MSMSNVFDSLITVGKSFQNVGAKKLKERLLKFVVQKGTEKRFWLAERRQRDGWYIWGRFLRYGGWLVDNSCMSCMLIFTVVIIKNNNTESVKKPVPNWSLELNVIVSYTIGKKSFGDVFKTLLQSLYINSVHLLMHQLLLCCKQLVLKVSIGCL